jgi:hypothetical protein
MRSPVFGLGAVLIVILLALSAYFTFPFTGQLISFMDGTTTSETPPAEPPEQIDYTQISDIFEDPGFYAAKTVIVKGELDYDAGEFYIEGSRGPAIRIEGSDLSPFYQGQFYRTTGILVAERYCSCYNEVPIYRRVSGGNMVVEECEDVIDGVCSPPYYSGSDKETYCNCMIRKPSGSYKEDLGRMRVVECREMEGRCDFPSIGWGEPFIIVTEMLPL